MDNTGNYTSIAKILAELGNAGAATAKPLVLSAKALVGGTEYSFTFAATGDAPVVGDFLVQGDYYATITNVTGTTLRADDATNIVNGKAKGITTDYSEADITDLISQAMAFIDRHTRQWFNRREFTGDDALKLEGNNSKTMFLPVPILEIYSVKKNGSDQVLPSDFYRVYNSRTLPDDRRNPMIKLQKDDDDVMFIDAGVWTRGTLTQIEGAFGFLEPDGSTPALIKRATTKLAVMYGVKSIGEAASTAASSSGAGPLKREKTDLHEIEFYDPNANSSGNVSSGTGLSGDDEIDDIIAAYRSPIIIGGSFPDIGHETPWLPSILGDSDRGRV